MTGATLFSGGGGADLGMTAAGVDVRWGLEYDDDIASVARENGLPIRTVDVTTADPAGFEAVDCLHASPPCQSFSVAKAGRKELESDREIARATAGFIEAIQPRIFTLEQVWGYRKSESWAIIQSALSRLGYDWNAWHINTADYGVPQTRKRMFVAAVKGGPRPTKPPATHAEEPPPPGLFGDTLDRWIGWYEAIEDLIPDLPDTEFADWQKERLPDEVEETLMIAAASADYANNNRPVKRPVYTIEAQPKGGIPRAIIVGTNSVNGGAPPLRSEDVPALASRPNDEGRLRAFLIGPNNGARLRLRGRPAPTQKASNASFDQRASIEHRVVQMMPRCLARFQSFPDWYELPDTKSLACRIIGNAVPPLFQQRLYEHLLDKA